MVKHRAHRHLRIEELEPRVAPAVILWDDMGIHSSSNGGISNAPGSVYDPL
jgi:hypothetical protein